MTRNELSVNEHDPYYGQYIAKLQPEISLIEGFEQGMETTLQFFNTVPEEKLQYRYESNKWTIKEVLQHLIDTERIFMYRCFRIARRDNTSLAGFDQNQYIEPSKANHKSRKELLEEYTIERKHSIMLLKSFSDDDLKHIGVANQGSMSARAAAFTVIGHELWHIGIIKERYL